MATKATSVTGRVEKLEATLTPTELVVRWLDEAHGYGGLEAYVESLVDEDPRRFPLNRLLLEAVAGVETAAGKVRDDGHHEARRRALRETAFRYQLVMGVNLGTHDLVIRQGLVHALITAYLGLFASDDPGKGVSSAGYVERYVQCVELAFGLVAELLASQHARESMEKRFLAGHPALFPDDARAFSELLHAAQRLAVMASRIAELDGVPAGDPTNPEGIAQRADVLTRDLVEQARITALEKLGEDRRAAELATSWLRTRAARVAPPAREPTP